MEPVGRSTCSGVGYPQQGVPFCGSCHKGEELPVTIVRPQWLHLEELPSERHPTGPSPMTRLADLSLSLS